MKDRDLFIEACFAKDLQQFYQDMINSSKGKAQLFSNVNGKLIHKQWNPSKICCESSQELTRDTIDIKIGYWTPFVWKPIRKDLKKEAMKREAYLCQKVDMSCNDCTNLKRENSWCNKLDKPVKVYPNTCHPQNIHCFEHRSDVAL
jgi:hypothetical protein